MADNIRMISLPECEGDVLLAVGDGLRIRLALRLNEEIADTDVLKVYASSPHLPDIYFGIADISGRECRFESVSDTKDSLCYDTVTVIKKNAFTDTSTPFLRVCFAEDKASEQLQYLKEHNAYREYLAVAPSLKSPALRGAEALDAFRSMHKNIEGEREKCIDRLTRVLSTCKRAEFSLADGFQWYEADTLAISRISTATEHILSVVGNAYPLSLQGHIKVGIDWDTVTLCIAIPEDNTSVNPMPHIDDCTVFVKSPISDTYYCVVGVNFAPDGQYFVRLNELDLVAFAKKIW